MLVADDAGLLEHPSCDTDGRTAHAKHHGQQILRQGKLGYATSIVSGEKPARQSLADLVVRVTGSRLGDLNMKGMNVLEQKVAQMRGFANRAVQRVNRHAVSRARSLAHCLAVGCLRTEDHRNARCPLCTDQTDFDRRSVGQDRHRRDEADFREVNMLDVRAGQVQCFAKAEINACETFGNQRELMRR